MTDVETAVGAWIEAWARGWPAKDVEVIASRYVDGPVYRSHPFREPVTARDYLSWAFGEQVDLRFWYGEPVTGQNRAVVEYWAVIRTTDGRDVTIAGTSVLRFDADGLVEEHRDYWAEKDGALEPPDGFGT